MNMTPDMIGYLGYLAATLTTASFLPQAILTIKTKDTQSLSLTMYTLFTLGVFCWLVYGIYIANKAIIFSNSITFLLAASILVFKIYNVLTNKE
jgi:MtN3 and saliva related transmembrane protein